jgi:hypothetical protein
MPRTIIRERVIPGKRLGRHIYQPATSVTHEAAETAGSIVSVQHQSSGLPLDQGNVGSCTANALCGALNTIPHWAAGQKTLAETQADIVYGKETALEGQPWPPNDPGGTGPEVCQASIDLGLLSKFQVAEGIDDALLALVPRPVITGINWYDSFDTPDENGLVEIGRTAVVRGGHEVCAVEIDALNELVWFWNSWGTSWGQGGRFCMSFATWGTLLNQQGDVTVPRTAKGWSAQLDALAQQAAATSNHPQGIVRGGPLDRRPLVDSPVTEHTVETLTSGNKASLSVSEKPLVVGGAVPAQVPPVAASPVTETADQQRDDVDSSVLKAKDPKAMDKTDPAEAMGVDKKG